MYRWALLVLVILAGCASQPLYSPAKNSQSMGYYETRLTDNRYRVTFTGGINTPLETVKNLALLRAAELTVENGFDWFEIVDRESRGDSRKSDAPKVSISVGVGNPVGRCYPFGCRVYGGPYYTGVGLWATETDERRQSGIEIFMGKGEHQEPTRVYNAQELETHLRDLTRK